jgi:hypothetical protein
MPASQILDRAHSLANIEVLEGAPDTFATALQAELPGGSTPDAIAARDAALSAALQRIDEMAARVMRIRLDHVLANDTAIPAPTRKVFASTVVSYAHRISLLADRVRDVAARAGAAHADAIAQSVVDAAEATLSLRASVAAGVLELVRSSAREALPEHERLARDRTRDDGERMRHSALRRELEALAAAPERVLAAPLADRLKGWPELLDEPPPEAEVTFADMIELD